MKPVAFAVVLIVGWACGASGVGRALIDAGTLLRDAGTARAQTNCTWDVKLGPSVATNGPVEQGWEPYAEASGSIMLRRCR
jgi:hypothetical protein